jgi:DNA mismatch repair protein MutS
VGDELCRGTESLSGAAITIGALEWLCEKGTSFIFSTHLHNIPTEKRIINLINNNKLSIYHLTTNYDHSLETLIYDRKLKEGPGESIYGIEVAKSLDIKNDFIKSALTIRKELVGESNSFLNTKKSRYNSNIYVDECNYCKKRTNLQTHHIKEQSMADKNGLIDHTHKNNSSNLIVLCQGCHQYLHSNGRHLNQLVTPEGTFIYIFD